MTIREQVRLSPAQMVRALELAREQIADLRKQLLTAREEGRRAGLEESVTKLAGLRELALQACGRNDERVQALRDAESRIRALLDAPEGKR